MIKSLGPFPWLALLLAIGVAALALFAPRPAPQEAPHAALLETLAPLPAASARAIPAAAASAHTDGWTTPLGDYAATRYSGLDQINPGNVGRLRPIFTFDTGIARGHEAPPLVVGTTMYLVTPYPNIVYALDLTRPDHPVKWTFRPEPLQAAQGVACCDVVNRGAVFDNGRLFFNTLD